MTSLPKESLKVQSTCAQTNLTFKVELPVASENLILIQGVNGLGKSTLFKLIKESSFNFNLNGDANYIHQESLNILEDLSLNDVISLLDKRLKRKRSDYFLKLYNAFSADQFCSKSSNELSGGQKQIVKILIGIYFKANYYFFDEPFQNLDRYNAEILKGFFKDLIQDKKQVYVIEHNHEFLPKNFVAGKLIDKDGVIHYVV